MKKWGGHCGAYGICGVGGGREENRIRWEGVVNGVRGWAQFGKGRGLDLTGSGWGKAMIVWRQEVKRPHPCAGKVNDIESTTMKIWLRKWVPTQSLKPQIKATIEPVLRPWNLPVPICNSLHMSIISQLKNTISFWILSGHCKLTFQKREICCLLWSMCCLMYQTSNIPIGSVLKGKKNPQLHIYIHIYKHTM